MGPWEALRMMPRRAEVARWPHLVTPLLRPKGISAALVLGARDSRAQGEGRQPGGGAERDSRMSTRRPLRGWR
jgi:hypothetical protein